MSSVLEKYKKAVGSFTSQEQFDHWLMTLGNALNVLDSQTLRQRTNYIKGCKNDCWIDRVDGVIQFDSNATQTKGLGKILTDVYNNSENVSALKYIDFKDITKGLGRDELIGFSKMLNRVHNLTNNK